MIPVHYTRLGGILLCCGWLFAACNKKSSPPPLFQLMDNTGVAFENKVRDNDTINILNYRNFYNGGGVAIGDINNDGLPDIFFTANQGPNKLYLNKGHFQFEDISAKAGFGDKQQFSTGVVMADVNHDGWLDIYVCNAGNMQNPELRKNQLFINNHQLGFADSAAAYGLADDGYSTQASFFDYDLDGDLDCMIINNSPIPVNSLNYPHMRDVAAKDWQVPDYLKGGGDHLYRNDGGKFTEVTQSAGIHGSLMSFGLGVTVGDINGDNLPDIYVSNDFFERDYLYINKGNGTFSDELEKWVEHTSYASMGADIGDVNNDGYPDIFTTDMLPGDDYRLKTTLSFDDIDLYRLKQRNGFYNQFLQNTLQVNNRTGRLEDIANFSGVNASEWSWGALMFDADNDGLTDLYVCNGIYRDLTNQDFLDFDANQIKEKMIMTGQKNLTELVEKIPSIAVVNKMYRNTGHLTFTDEAAAWGMGRESFSNGAAYADLDNDGDLDIVVNNVNEPAFIYKNNSREQNHNHYLSVSLTGAGENTFAIGSKILAYKKNGEVLSREVMPSKGFQSSVDYRQIIGLGKDSLVDSLEIIWPNLMVTRVVHPASDQALSFTQPSSGEKITPGLPRPIQPLLIPVATTFDKHTENDFIDFYQERAIPEMLSCEGPKAAVADINGDGLDDLYIGGTPAHPGQLYLQQPNGSFSKKGEPAFSPFSTFEDGALLFFDCDGDKDMDLLIGPGGNEALPATREQQFRLFINDGKGNFALTQRSFPLNKDNVGALVAFDMDGDGDLDLFAGGRSVSGQYGITPLSHVYINDGKGQFTEMPAEKTGGLSQAGMVTGAVWADLEGNGKKMLVVVGEWMSPKIFRFSGDHFTEVKSSLDGMAGWWQTVQAADLNGDGKADLILGNYGDNFCLHPDPQHPVKMWIHDFDGNGVDDKIISKYVEGMDKPVFMKREVQDGLPVLKKQNLRHAEFAKKSIQQLFTATQLTGADIKEVTYTSSIIALSQGNEQFLIHPLPVPVQWSSVRAVLVTDLNKDGKPDLVLGGNEFNFQPQLGRLDANHGEILIGTGTGDFNLLDTRSAGPDLSGMVRDIAFITGKENNFILFLLNNEYPVLFREGSKGRGQ